MKCSQLLKDKFKHGNYFVKYRKQSPFHGPKNKIPENRVNVTRKDKRRSKACRKAADKMRRHNRERRKK